MKFTVKHISRRMFLTGIGAGTVGLVLTSCMGRHAATGSVAGGGTDSTPFAEPTVLRSSSGTLNVELVASEVQVPWANGTRFALAYNDSVPGPTLRVRPGDTVRLTLRNSLDEPTNLHTHGLHVPPSGDSDNIFVMVAPGESRTYTYEIPADHSGGTFWYHPHHHGTVARQVAGGLAGAIIVEDDDDDSPEFSSTNDRLVVISDPVVGKGQEVLDTNAMTRMMGREGDVILVNGSERMTLAVSTARAEKFRVVNASASRYYRVGFGGARFAHIASDQGRFAGPVDVESVTLTPGQRAEIVVTPQPGMTGLTVTPVDRNAMHGMGGMNGMSGMMGSGNGGPANGTDVLLVGFDVTSSGEAPLFDPRPRRVPTGGEWATGQRALTLGAPGMSMSGAEFVINGKNFEAGRIDTSCVLGTTEDWTITNLSAMDHPFHLHVWPFKVMSRSSGATPDPGWRDTVNIAAGETVVIRVPFMDHAGTTVFHCHILDHEDLGMMGTISVE